MLKRNGNQEVCKSWIKSDVYKYKIEGFIWLTWWYVIDNLIFILPRSLQLLMNMFFSFSYYFIYTLLNHKINLYPSPGKCE